MGAFHWGSHATASDGSWDWSSGGRPRLADPTAPSQLGRRRSTRTPHAPGGVWLRGLLPQSLRLPPVASPGTARAAPASFREAPEQGFAGMFKSTKGVEMHMLLEREAAGGL